MKASPTGLILWILGATGVFLLYCAVKGFTPQSVLAAFINRTTVPVPFSSSAKPATGTGGGAGGFVAPLDANGLPTSVGTVFPGGVGTYNPPPTVGTVFPKSPYSNVLNPE